MIRQWSSEWDAVWGPANGMLPGWDSWHGSTNSYLENYQNDAGGHWERQDYGTSAANDPITWHGYDWIWAGPYEIGWLGLLLEDIPARHITFRNGSVYATDRRGPVGTFTVHTGMPPDAGLPSLKLLKGSKDVAALIQIAKRAKKTGVTVKEAKILLEWARE